MEITVKPLTPDTLDDFLSFFDGIEFHDHPDWSVCYCYSFHFMGTAEEWNNKERNRATVIRLIHENHMHGYLAYDNGRPIGWCNADNKSNFIRLKHNKELWDNGNMKICSVVCFLVDPALRGKGVATRLLEQVCTDYRDLGYDYIEAYPQKNKTTNEEQCQGPLSLYRSNGFEITKEFTDFTLVRKRVN